MMRWKSCSHNTLCKGGMCDIAQINMKEEVLRAICNICIILFFIGLMLMIFLHTREAFSVGFILMAIACGVGFICGSLLDGLIKSKHSRKQRQIAIREQDERDIRSGKYLYVLEKDKEPVKRKIN